MDLPYFCHFVLTFLLNIFQRIESLGSEPDAQALPVAERGRPADMDAIVNSADCPEIAAEIYVA